MTLFSRPYPKGKGIPSSFALKMCPEQMSDGTFGIVQRIRDAGVMTIRLAKHLLREQAKHPNSPAGYYWIEDPRGIPIYGIHARDEPKTERVPTVKHDPAFPGSQHHGFTTRKVPGQVQRVLKAGDMPWNR